MWATLSDHFRLDFKLQYGTMLDQYIGESMVSIMETSNGINELIHGYQKCNTNQIEIYGGYVKVR